MTIEDKYDFVKKVWDEYMFISQTSKFESAEDKDIPFSVHDIKRIYTYTYKNKPDEISIYYNRVSHVFQWANEVLEQWRYKHKLKKYSESFIHREYCWEHPILSSITINNNFAYIDRFKIYAKYDGTFFKVESKIDIEKELEKTIKWLIKDKKDKQLLRKLSLNELLNEN